MDLVKAQQKTYSSMYFATAILHLLYLIIFAINDCNILAVINGLMILCYVILGSLAKKATYFIDIFITCGIAMTAYIMSHYIYLGPSYGFQYLVYGSIPLVFYLAYSHGKSIKSSRIISFVCFLLFAVVSVICTFIKYPLIHISRLSTSIIASMNIIVSFMMVIYFMTMFVTKVSKDTGLLKNKNEDIEQSANIDTLTGLMNRRSLDEYIARAFAQAKGEGKDFSILMCDIDNFKHVNDTYGHDCGDAVLKNIAKIIKEETRPDDIIFRWGGEEILILTYGSFHIAGKIAERCRKAIEESEVTYRDATIKVTITIGGASYYQGSTKEILIERADGNLYTGKTNGKNQVVM